MQLNGIFILAELPEEVAEKVRELNERYDPKLARYKPPHITLTGSSGAGPIPPSVSVEEIRDKLEPIAADTAPITLSFQAPQRFMQTDIIVLPDRPAWSAQGSARQDRHQRTAVRAGAVHF